MNVKKVSTYALQSEYDSLHEWRNQEADEMREKGWSEDIIRTDPTIVNLNRAIDIVIRELRRRDRADEALRKIYNTLRNVIHRTR